MDYPQTICICSSLIIQFPCSLALQEFISFYDKKIEELNEFTDLDTNFTLILPFRNANLSFDSEVSFNQYIVFKLLMKKNQS